MDDFRQRGAWTNVLGRKAIDLRVTAIAQDEPLLVVERANALRQIVDHGLKAPHPRGEGRDRGAKFALDDFNRDGRQPANRDQVVLIGSDGRFRPCLRTQKRFSATPREQGQFGHKGSR